MLILNASQTPMTQGQTAAAVISLLVIVGILYVITRAMRRKRGDDSSAPVLLPVRAVFLTKRREHQPDDRNPEPYLYFAAFQLAGGEILELQVRDKDFTGLDPENTPGLLVYNGNKMLGFQPDASGIQPEE